MSLPLNDFLTFLNERQRDPRLNEILFPVTKKSEAGALVLRHEKGRTKGKGEREGEGERERGEWKERGREGGREREGKRERGREGGEGGRER